MGEPVYVLGAYASAFGRLPESTHKELTREALVGVLRDAGLKTGADIDAACFGCCFMDHWGQNLIRGNVCFIPLVREGLFPDRAPIVNVEGACATGSLALWSAYQQIKSGDADLALAMGIEKLYDPVHPEAVLRRFSDGMDRFDPHEWEAHYAEFEPSVGHRFAPGSDRTIAMDTYALQALLHMQRHGTTQEQIAYGAAKNHTYGALNPRAQYRFAMTAAEVLADRPVTPPLTRSMCAPIGDGAAAVLVCSESFLSRQPAATRSRAALIKGVGVTGGKYRGPDEPSLSYEAAAHAYTMAGVSPAEIDVAEVHDATSFSEIYQAEMLGFCEIGDGGSFVASGGTAIGGKTPINTSGGLVSKGHPLAATGLSMCFELITQLREEAGARQVEGARIALQENGGGIVGLEEALAAVVIYEAVDF